MAAPDPRQRSTPVTAGTKTHRSRLLHLDQAGLTLVEILAAAVVIGIGLVGLFFVVPISSYGVQEGNQLSTATFLAEQRMEQVRGLPWTSVPANDCVGVGPAGQPVVPAGASCTNGSTTLAAGAVTFADEANVTGYTGYARTVRVQDCGVTACAGITNSDMRLVTVNVTYRPMTGVGAASNTGSKTVRVGLVISRR